LERLSKRERIQAALALDDVDRIPVGIWLHHPDVDQDPRALAETQVDFARKFDLDFIKLCPFGLYSVQDWGCRVKFFNTKHDAAVVDDYGINSPLDWGALEELPATYGTWGKQLQLAWRVKKQLRAYEDIPVLQTIFSPLTTARKLAGDRVFADMKESPALLHQALQVITDTTVNFIKGNIDAGIGGFFFATQCASTELMTEAEYDEFGSKYDLQLFEAYASHTYFNVIHIHGDHVMFEKLASYPGNCINWHDRWVYPSLTEARNLTDKCLLGGLRENDVLLKGTSEDVKRHVAEAVEEAGGKGFILGPGCVADTHTPEANFYAARLALEAYAAPLPLKYA
jgi:uroporphyrinogen decarboxylase